MADIKSYKPSTNSLGAGQVLQCPYEFEKARLIAWEMTDALVLDLVDKGLVTDQIILTVGYDIENLSDPQKRAVYQGDVTIDYYGRATPKHAHGTENLGKHSSSAKEILHAVMTLFERIVDRTLLVRRIHVTANHVIAESEAPKDGMEQLNLFEDYEAIEKKQQQESAALAREKKVQAAVLDIKKKYGKNAILKGVNFTEGATAKDRNAQIGGHKA